MKNARRQNCSLIAMAAYLRAAGKSWEEIATAIGRSADRIRKWPRWYAEDWCRYFHQAEHQFLSEVAIEVRLLLRKLARSESEETQLAVCALVLKSRFNELAKMAFQPPEKPADPNAELTREKAAFIQEIDNMSDDELAAMIKDACESKIWELPSKPDSADEAASS
jgi:hypothetical protein